MCSDSHLCILKRRIVFNALTALQNLLFEVTVKELLLGSLLKKNLVDAFPVSTVWPFPRPAFLRIQ